MYPRLIIVDAWMGRNADIKDGIGQWMDDKPYLDHTHKDVLVKLYLISRVLDLKQAGEYLDKIPFLSLAKMLFLVAEVKKRVLLDEKRNDDVDFDYRSSLPIQTISAITVDCTKGGQSGSLVGKGSACNRDCGRRSSSVYVLRKLGSDPFLLFTMSNITDIKSILTQKGLDILCHKFGIPEDFHPQLPSHNQTIHEMPTGKIGVYTRFFEYANFRLPLSTFLVNILRHYHINLSQLSVIAAAKVSYFEILCRVHSIEPTVGLLHCFYVNSKNKGWMSFSKRPDRDAVCYNKPLDSLKHWNDHFFWVDSFACPASFPWHTDKNVSRDTFPKSTEFNADNFVVLVAHPAPFQKFPNPFLYMDLFAFIQVVDPTKVKVVEREHAEGEEKLLDSTVGHVVLLIPVALTRAESELEASVENLFDEGGSTKQGDSIVGGGHDSASSRILDMVVEDTVVGNVTAERHKRQRKKMRVVTNASGSSHPPKKLREDHGTSSEAATGGKSSSVLKELLASSILNVEAGVEAVANLPLVTSSVSATPERESGVPTDCVTGLNLRTIGPSERFVISSDSSHHSSTNAAEAGIDSFVRYAAPHPVMTEAIITTNVASIPSVQAPETGTKVISSVHASIFHDTDSMGTVRFLFRSEIYLMTLCLMIMMFLGSSLTT
ncbi:hypothetical protein Tco_0669718 [Tanacetum coccineum]